MLGTVTGVPPNVVQAYKCFILGAPVMGRDDVAAYMTPAQIAEARRMAREWVAKQ
jgi:hypothetical protein